MSTLPFCLVTVLRFQNWKSSHLGLMSSTVLWQASIGLFIQLSCFHVYIYRFSKSTLPFCLDVTVLRFQDWNLGILVLSYKSSTVVCERHASISLYIQLSWEVSISRRCLEAWKILTLIESNSTSLCFLMVCGSNWKLEVCGIGHDQLGFLKMGAYHLS